MQYTTIRITRESLEFHSACNSGLEIFDHLANETGVLEFEWSPLAALWLAVEYPDEVRWLHQRGLIPPANLRNCVLQGLDLRGAYLVGAWLDGADFCHAYMKNCLLQRAEVKHADFTGADLSGANLTGAKTVVFTYLRRVASSLMR